MKTTEHHLSQIHLYHKQDRYNCFAALQSALESSFCRSSAVGDILPLASVSGVSSLLLLPFLPASEYVSLPVLSVSEFSAPPFLSAFECASLPVLIFSSFSQLQPLLCPVFASPSEVLLCHQKDDVAIVV